MLTRMVCTATLLGALVAGSSATPVPGLYQHLATAMDNHPMTTLTVYLPNPAGSGNTLLLGIQYNSAGWVKSVTDDQSNTWKLGPIVTSPTKSAAGEFQKMAIYYVIGAKARTRKISVAFGGLTGTNGYPQAVASEFYNVGGIDATCVNASSLAVGPMRTTTAGDLIYEWGVDFSATNSKGGAFNGTSITAGTGFSLLSADLQVGSGDQYQIQTFAGAITPKFTVSGSGRWGAIAIALKPAQAGTHPSGLHIVHMQHELLASANMQNRPNPLPLQFPSSGNLMIATFTGAGDVLSGMTDSANNTWRVAASTAGESNCCSAVVMYAANAKTSSSLRDLTTRMNPFTGSGDDMLILYDIAGASSSPLDVHKTSIGTSHSSPFISTSLTPSAAGEFVVDAASVYYDTLNGTATAGQVLDAVVNGFDCDGSGCGTSPSTLEMDDGFSHLYSTGNTTITFRYLYNSCNGGGVYKYGTAAAAFKP